MFYLRDLPKYEAIRARASRYPGIEAEAVEAFLLLLRVGSDVFAALERFLKAYKLTQGSWTVLMVLNRYPDVPLRPSGLADQCGVTRATMTGLVDGLERKKLVRREPDAHDRRIVLVRLTPKAIAQMDVLALDYYRRIAGLMADLTAEDRRQLSGALMRVAVNVAAIADADADGAADEG